MKKLKDGTTMLETTMYGGSSAHGLSTVIVDCPFCKQGTECYIWSLHGSGKKCPNCKDVLLTWGMAFDRSTKKK